MQTLIDAVSKLRASISDRRHVFSDLAVEENPRLQRATLFDTNIVPRELQDEILGLAESAAVRTADPGVDRAKASMLGMAIADSWGHNFEFLPVRDVPDPNGPFFEYPAAGFPGGRVHRPLNQFRLRPGQWTDDTSMGLCMADSLLLKNGYDGSNIRVWFWNWWNNGLDNAFRLDRERASHSFFGGSLSVGLGGNISKSLNQIDHYARKGRVIPSRFDAEGEDAGNGSLMRLAPVPLWFHQDIAQARAMSFESSLTTHPGPLAAEACAFMAHVLVSALHRPADDQLSAREFLDRLRDEYLSLLGTDCSGARASLRRLLLSEEPESGTERCWNWRSESLEIERTLQARGRQYNGYPVSSGYFGAFSFDGLALALHCVYQTADFNSAIAKVINFCGDADTTGAICGQIAGAFYGTSDIDPAWIAAVRQWDERHIELRAVALYVAGLNASDEAESA